MSDKKENVVNCGKSPEEIAYMLMDTIFHSEGKSIAKWDGKLGETRQSILDTYAECLQTVKGQRTTTSFTLKLAPEKENA